MKFLTFLLLIKCCYPLYLIILLGFCSSLPLHCSSATAVSKIILPHFSAFPNCFHSPFLFFSPSLIKFDQEISFNFNQSGEINSDQTRDKEVKQPFASVYCWKSHFKIVNTKRMIKYYLDQIP